MDNRSLDQLYKQLKEVEELLKFSKIFGGKANIGNEIITSIELKEMRDKIKAEITSRVSQTNLRIVK